MLIQTSYSPGTNSHNTIHKGVVMDISPDQVTNHL